MTIERKQEIISNLMTVYNEWEPPEYLSPYESDIHMFDLVSGYNKRFGNPELIGGDWVRENCPEPLKSLPA